MTGAETLAAILDGEHEVTTWQDADTTRRRSNAINYDPTRVTVGGIVYLVEHTAAVRHRDTAAVIYDEGRVRVLVAAGELILDDAEEQDLRAGWPTL